MTEIVSISKAELQELVSLGVQDALVKLGVQANDPLEMQKDFQHLRDWRTSMEQMKKKSLIATVTILITGLAAMFWMGVKAALNGN